MRHLPLSHSAMPAALALLSCTGRRVLVWRNSLGIVGDEEGGGKDADGGCCPRSAAAALGQASAVSPHRANAVLKRSLLSTLQPYAGQDMRAILERVLSGECIASTRVQLRGNHSPYALPAAPSCAAQQAFNKRLMCGHPWHIIPVARMAPAPQARWCGRRCRGPAESRQLRSQVPPVAAFSMHPVMKPANLPAVRCTPGC